ncbi:hypothetical protein I5S63_09485 [Pseudomonas juntendi]|nr:hypothetical protein [Pseudomonas juntendi]
MLQAVRAAHERTPPIRHFSGAKKSLRKCLALPPGLPFIPFLTNSEKIFSMLALKHLATVSPFKHRGQTDACHQIETVGSLINI